MNRIHRIVWYASRGLWQVVSEINRRSGGQGRRAAWTAAGRVIAAGSLLLWGAASPAQQLPTGTQVVAGEARTGVGGNQLVIGQGKAAAAKQGDSRASLPVRKAGLWEVTVQAHAPQGMRGAKQGPMTVQQCTDAKAEQVMLLSIVPGQDTCTERKVAKRAGQSGKGYDIATVCNVHDQRVVANVRLIGDLQTAYSGTYSVEYPGASLGNVGPVDFQGRWLGSCTPVQRPGDMVLPNGITVNVVDDALRRGKHHHHDH